MEVKTRLTKNSGYHLFILHIWEATRKTNSHHFALLCGGRPTT